MKGRRTGKAAVRAAIDGAEPAEPVPASGRASAAPDWMAAAFEMRADGLYRRAKDGDSGAMWLSGPFSIEAETRDDEGRNWGFLLAWWDRDGVRHEEIFPRALFNNDCAELRTRLAEGGLAMNALSAARQAFAQFLNVCRTEHRARSVTRGGWHVFGERWVFVRADRIFAEAGERIVLQLSERESHAWHAAGTLAQWREEVSRLCLWNSRLTFAVSCAFAAPLLRLVGEDGGGFHFYGKSRTGKTTTLRVAASACGGLPGQGAAGHIRQWRTTGNALEATAATYSDCLLLLDEMGQADAREVGEISYLLANGAGKARASRSGGARAALRFRVLFVSTGEVRLTDNIAEAGGNVKAGQQVRLVDIPGATGSPHELFEELHGEASADAFVTELRRLTSLRYGTALPAFLTWLVTRVHRERQAFLDMLRERASALLNEWLKASPGAGGQVALGWLPLRPGRPRRRAGERGADHRMAGGRGGRRGGNLFPRVAGRTRNRRRCGGRCGRQAARRVRDAARCQPLRHMARSRRARRAAGAGRWQPAAGGAVSHAEPRRLAPMGAIGARAGNVAILRDVKRYEGSAGGPAVPRKPQDAGGSRLHREARRLQRAAQHAFPRSLLARPWRRPPLRTAPRHPGVGRRRVANSENRRRPVAIYAHYAYLYADLGRG